MTFASMTVSDFFQDGLGIVQNHPWRRRTVGYARDAVVDLAAQVSGAPAKIRRIAAATPRRRILVVGVAVPTRPGEMDRVVAALRRTRHEVVTSIVPMAPVSKFQNVTTAIQRAGEPVEAFDWVIITDDDVRLPPGFLDHFIGLLEAGEVDIGQPAHRFHSYSTYKSTQRFWGSLVRETRFVEIGPLTAVRPNVLAQLMPFPVSRWDWGLDVYWAQLARERGWRMGVADGAAVEHLRPVAGTYDAAAAIADGEAFLARQGVTLTRAECFGEERVLIPW